MIFGGCGVLLGLALQRFLKEPERGAADLADLAAGEVPHKHVRMPFAEFARVILGRPTARLPMAAFLCQNFMAMVLFTWMPTFLYEKFHLNPAMAGLTATLYIQTASLIGSVAGG